MSPERVVPLLVSQVEETPGRASLEKLGCRTPPQLRAGGGGRQQLEYNIGSEVTNIISRLNIAAESKLLMRHL